jgi:glycosyltransferase involved in cell wall biosynthesis
MRILLIAPQPFFENRGTPIAVRNMLQTLGRLGHKTDLVAYHAGEDIRIPGTTVYRCARLPFRSIPIGFSPVKLPLDALTYAVVVRRLMTRRYDVIHSVEEGIFLALLAPFRRNALLCYDMDSSLTEQLLARGKLWCILAPLLRSLEKWALRKSACVVSVCPALSDYVRNLVGKKPIFQIEDTPIIRLESLSARQETEFREKLSLRGQKTVVYIGNFEAYQGIDLLLSAFALVVKEARDCTLVLVGGSEKAIVSKRRIARNLGLERNTLFLGFIPPEKAGPYLSLADVLVSPRIRGTNFPMKVYSYLASGKPLVATDLPVHSQILTRETAFLVPPTAQALARGIVHILLNPDVARSLGQAGKRFVQAKFTTETYERKVGELYRWIAAELERRRNPRSRRGKGA